MPISAVPPPWFMGVSALVAPGTILLPGNWLRIIQTRAAFEPTAKAQLEYEGIFEEIRLKEAPDAPSRLSCVFVSPDRECLDRFTAEHPQRTDVVYRVEPIEDLATAFVARWKLWSWREINEGTSMKARKSARRYWTEPASGPGRELLVPCPVRVLDLL